MDKQKILIFAGGLHIGGAERVAANISKYASDDMFEFHYLVFDCNENVYGPEIEAKGGRVFTLPLPNKGYLAYIRSVDALMKEHQYAAVHSHTMFNSGINLAVARANRIPVRVAHSHTTKTETPVSIPQRVYEYLMRQLILCTATHRVGCGVDAGKWLFGAKAFERNGYVMRNGIDTDAHAWSPENRARIRRQYGLENSFVIGHTGTLTRVKNQGFLIRLMPQILQIRPEAVLMLVGANEGENLENLQEIARECGVEDRVIFTGPVLNVNEYLSVFDVFAFPSTREGTPLSLLEAQANGLPCIVSENVPVDAFLTDLIRTLSLDDPQAWIEHLCSAHRANCAAYPAKIAACGYDARSAYGQLYDLYRGGAVRRKAVVSLSFDDGRGDNTRIVDEVLLPRKIPATLNITTGYVDGTCPANLRPSEKPAMRKEDVVRLARHPLIEIGLHGDRHENTPEDILAGREKLIAWLDLEKDHVFGFASPKSRLDREIWDSPAFAPVRRIALYMRAGLRVSSHRLTRAVFRKIGHTIHLPAFFTIGFGDTKMAFRDGKFVHSVSVLKETTPGQVFALIDDCIKCNASVNLMFHSVLDNCAGEDAWTWSRDRFERLCHYLVEKRETGELDLCTTREMFERLQ